MVGVSSPKLFIFGGPKDEFEKIQPNCCKRGRKEQESFVSGVSFGAVISEALIVLLVCSKKGTL